MDKMSIKLHPRYFIVRKASLDYGEVLSGFMKAHEDLTYVELVQILVEHIQNYCLKYMLRMERHPDDPEKKGDEE